MNINMNININTKQLLLAAVLAGAFVPALAAFDAGDAPMAFDFDSADAGQNDAGAEPRERTLVRERVVLDRAEMAHLPHFDPSAFTGPLMLTHGRVVKNAPYSAQVVNEQQHNLSDGNQIINKSSSLTYRDSAGRTRQETRDANGAVRSITIRDTVAGATYILRPESKTAIKLATRPVMANASEQAALAAERARMASERARMASERAHMASEGGREAGERARVAAEKARERAEEARRHGDDHIVVKRVERTDGEAGHRIHEDVRIRFSPNIAEGHPMAGADGFGPMIAGAFGDMKWSGKASTRDLGTKEIEGVKAQGKLRSYEIPAGEIGNRNPIVVSTESWYSPDLQVTLLSKRSDPRSGERIYRLEGIRRDEPAAALFTVPSDYTVKEPMTKARKAIENKIENKIERKIEHKIENKK
jgi:hypothetical protein